MKQQSIVAKLSKLIKQYLTRWKLGKLGNLKRPFLKIFKYYELHGTTLARVVPCKRAWTGLSKQIILFI